MQQLELALGPSLEELSAKHKALREHIELVIDLLGKKKWISAKAVLEMSLDNDEKPYAASDL